MDSGFRALDELRKAGIVGAIGVGINRKRHQHALHQSRRLRLHAAGRALHASNRARSRIPAGMHQAHTSRVILGGPTFRAS
jgi:hypothetical protein